MGNRVDKPAQQTPTVDEVTDSLKSVLNTTDLNKFVHIIKQVLEEKSNKRSTIAMEKAGMLTPFITTGTKFLYFVNDQTSKIQDEGDTLSLGKSRVVAKILKEIGKAHWVVGGLVLVAYLIENAGKVCDNNAEALKLLRNMVDLATTLIKLEDVMPEEEEKLKTAVMVIVQGSIMCVSIHSVNIFSFLRTSINSKNLRDMSETVHHYYEDLNLTITTTIAKRQPKLLHVRKPFYPKDAVGIENAQKEVIELLYRTPEDDSARVVVIYGNGGIGKTTLATSVVAMLNLENYNYARVRLDEDKMSKNRLKQIQQHLLRDAFPIFHSGNTIDLRDCQEGRERLKEAFQYKQNKPVFLFFDNVLRTEDLKELLPEDSSDLPKRSRILVTARMLAATDLFEISGLKRYSFAVKTLKNDHAVEILCRDHDNRERIKHDLERILRVCGGVPLVLRIVGRHLVKSGYDADKCSILDALQKGADVKEDNLTQSLIDFAYNGLEEGTKDSFLDICCFFNGWIRRHVEYIVGAAEVKSLEEAALVTSVVDDDHTSAQIMEDNDIWGIYHGEQRLIVPDIVRAKGLAMSASTRYMDVKSFCAAAQDETRLEGIKGLWFDDSSSEYVLDVKHLNSMSRTLRIMHLEWNTATTAQSPMKFKELRYLDVWNEVPHLPMKVDELDMLGIYQGPAIFPNGSSMNKLPKRLSMINQAPRISRFVSAEESSSTQSTHNQSLQELQLLKVNDTQLLDGLHQLSSLKVLSLTWSWKVNTFPEQVCKLSSLIKLRIENWKCLKGLPQSFGQLQGLTHLEIRECGELEEVHSSFGQLRSLEHLSLSSCPELKRLPAGLESLKDLTVSHCRKLRQLPGGVSLRYLNVSHCPELRQLPDGVDSLKYLYVRDCERLSLESYQSKPGLSIVVLPAC